MYPRIGVGFGESSADGSESGPKGGKFGVDFVASVNQLSLFLRQSSMYIHIRGQTHVINGIKGDVDFWGVGIIDGKGSEVVDVGYVRGQAWSLEWGCLQRPTIGDGVVVISASMHIVTVVDVIEVKLQIVGVERVSSVVRINGAPVANMVS